MSAPPYHDIENKVEESLAAYITATVTSTQLNGAVVSTAISDQDLTSGNRVIAMCKKSAGRSGLPGNFMAEASAVLRTKANPKPSRSLSAHRLRLRYLRDAILDDNLPNLLDMADFTVQGVSTEWDCETRLDEDHWESELRIQLLCCPS